MQHVGIRSLDALFFSLTLILGDVGSNKVYSLCPADVFFLFFFSTFSFFLPFIRKNLASTRLETYSMYE